jgi:hypothetical protein
VPASEPFEFFALRGIRITAAPAAIDAATWPSSAIVIRIAPDDAFVIDASLDDAVGIIAADPHAIVEDEPMFRGAWLDGAQLAHLADRLEWPLPTDRPVLAQGMAAALSLKLWLEPDRTLLVVSESMLHEVIERLSPTPQAAQS